MAKASTDDEKPKRKIHIPGSAPRIPDADTLARLASDYFNSTPENEWTITGLVMHLGFVSRQSFYDYEKREKYRDVIRMIRTAIESSYEKDLKTGNYKSAAGPIFALKQFKWVEPVEHGGAVGLYETEEPEKRAARIAEQLAKGESLDDTPPAAGTEIDLLS